ncbi:hypothetical protein P12x_004693 [Tundrisphaera lichenicola]|uniref:hypothetical protein n=1 Tax=Tundrisphaera lichenicola TaxID=2029860 RepID=UPI003EBB34E1
MTIQLPVDLERSLQEAVKRGRFESVDAAIIEATRLILGQLDHQAKPEAKDDSGDSGLGFIGALREDAVMLDRAVEHAMQVREERPWRLKPVE